MSDHQAYHNGDFWEPMEPVSAGESPAEPKWRRLRVPEEIKQAVVHLAAGYVLIGDGHVDQARVFLSQGEELLRRASHNLANQHPMPMPVRLR